MNALQDACPDVTIDGYEVRIPVGHGFDNRLDDLLQFGGIDLFAELPWDDEMNDRLAALAEREIYAKARTGGEAIPTADQLAGLLVACHSLDLPFKLTAGLHHAWSSKSSFGFLNVLGSLAFQAHAELAPSEVAALLGDGRADDWRFGEEAIRHGSLEADLRDIADARALMISFGSCSVVEPLEDLARLRH